MPLFAIAQIDTISNPIDTTTTPIDTIPEPPIVVNPPTPIPNGLAKDTIYSKVIDGYFYIVRRNVQDNGSYTETSEFVGDTTGDLYNALNKHNNISILNINTTASDWSDGYFLAYYLPANSFYPSFQFTGTLQEMFFYHNDQSLGRTNLENNINSYYSIY